METCTSLSERSRHYLDLWEKQPLDVKEKTMLVTARDSLEKVIENLANEDAVLTDALILLNYLIGDNE